MNTSTKLILSTLAMAGAGLFASPAALARDDVAAAPTLTRAEVRAEVVRAQRAGELTYGEFGQARNDFLARSTVVKSRTAQAQAEAAEAGARANTAQVTAR